MEKSHNNLLNQAHFLIKHDPYKIEINLEDHLFTLFRRKQIPERWIIMDHKLLEIIKSYPSQEIFNLIKSFKHQNENNKNKVE